MKLQLLYRILTMFVNMLAVFFALSLISSITVVFSNPAMALSMFLMFGVVAYAWFANKFFNNVIVRQQDFSKSQIDWLQVNAVVSLVLSGLFFMFASIIFSRPDLVKTIIDSLPAPIKDPEQFLRNAAVAFAVMASVLVVHVIWTLVLLRNYKRWRNTQQ